MSLSMNKSRSLPDRLGISRACELLEALSLDELDIIISEIAAVLKASDERSNVIAVNFRQAHDEGD